MGASATHRQVWPELGILDLVTYDADYAWPADTYPPSLAGTATVIWGSTGGASGPTNSWMESAPALALVHADVAGETSFPGSDGPHNARYELKTRTEVKLFTGGKGVDRNLHKLSAALDELQFHWTHDGGLTTNIGPIAPQSIELGSLGALDANGELYAALADGQDIVITPKAAGIPNQGGTLPVKAKYKLKILRGGSDITDKTSPAIVGQHIDLGVTLGDLGPLTDIQWAVPGNTISNYLWGATYSYVYTDYVKTNTGVAFYWVDGGNNREVLVSAKYNGQLYTAKTIFNVIRPLPSFSAQIRDEVRVGTNFGVNGAFAPGYRLQFGANNNGVANAGIAFVYTGAPRIPNTTNTYGSYALCQVIESWSQQYNWTNGGVCEGYQFGGGQGLDHNFPSLGPASDASSSPTNSWSDSPGTPLGIASWLSHANSFSTFLMFQPRFGGIYVPMYQMSWQWSGSATNNPWGKQSGSASAGAPSVTTQFPYWTHPITNIDTSPVPSAKTNCFQ
jgi:hypothetical protein